MIPVMPQPVIPKEPPAPNLADQFPDVLVITKKDVDFYNDACDAWESEDYSTEQMKKDYPGMSRAASCDWAIYGQTIQGQFNLESIFVQQATYAAQLRSHIQVLTEIIESQWSLSVDTQKAMQEANSRPANTKKTTFFQRLFGNPELSTDTQTSAGQSTPATGTP